MIILESEYISGVCNIGSAEISARRRFGILGLVTSLIGAVIYFLAILQFKISPLIGFILLIPLFMSSIGYIQARQKFCAAYGFSSKYNVSSSLGNTLIISNDILRKNDRRKAYKIFMQSFLIAFVINSVFILIGYLLSS